jgi:flagellar basal-body rod modification protein FlgD
MSIGATEPVTYTGIFGTAPTTGAAAGATTTTSKSADKDMFLQLLVAQMKYQDPMNPTDSGQFLAQSAQFTALEKMQDVADQTARLLSAQMAFGASGLIG